MSDTVAIHQWHIDEREYRRHEQRRGRRHAYESIDGSSTALVVVDMVQFFVAENPYTRGIVPNINRLTGATRAVLGVVAWVVPAVRPPTEWERGFYGDVVAEAYAESGSAPLGGSALWSDLTTESADVRAEKHAASAFFPGRCDLDDQLRSREIDTVLIAGTVANVCCESTLRDASALGYRSIMVADAVSATTDAVLSATLHTVYRSFGDVRTTAELCQLLAKS